MDKHSTPLPGPSLSGLRKTAQASVTMYSPSQKGSETYE